MLKSQATENNTPAEEHEPTTAEVVEASVKGQDRPMEKEHPTSPGALVWFTFPAALILALLATLAAVYWFY